MISHFADECSQTIYCIAILTTKFTKTKKNTPRKNGHIQKEKHEDTCKKLNRNQQAARIVHLQEVLIGSDILWYNCVLWVYSTEQSW